jgi:hypothetical protein
MAQASAAKRRLREKQQNHLFNHGGHGEQGVENEVWQQVEAENDFLDRRTGGQDLQEDHGNVGGNTGRNIYKIAINLYSVLSVSFDSLAPARLTLRANLWLFYLKGPAFSIVVNPPGFSKFLKVMTYE